MGDAEGMMTEQQLREALAFSKHLSDSDLGETVIYSFPPQDWAGVDQDLIDEVCAEFDEFLRKAFSALPLQPRLDYVEGLAMHYALALVYVEDASKKLVRALESTYARMLGSVAESMESTLLWAAESPDHSLTVSAVAEKITRYRQSLHVPRFGV